MNYKRLWIGFIFVMVSSFAVLGYFGYEIYLQAPPIPEKVVTPAGDVVFTGQQIKDGQNVWQSIGGQEVGSVWGHGAYVAPDWSADFLHRELVEILDRWSGSEGSARFAQLLPEKQAALMLFCLKGLATRNVWKSGSVRFAFWSINIGLALMVLIGLLPVGLMQTWASVEHGLWYARSAEFMQTPIMNILRWLRVIGDTIFAVGVLALVVCSWT